MKTQGPVEQFQMWVRTSRAQAREVPSRYLIGYEPDELKIEGDKAYMSQETYDRILRYCGEYNGTLPTGRYVGKMFIRKERLWWIGIDKESALTHIAWNNREIVITDGR